MLSAGGTRAVAAAGESSQRPPIASAKVVATQIELGLRRLGAGSRAQRSIDYLRLIPPLIKMTAMRHDGDYAERRDMPQRPSSVE
jgi:hypothetical protein